MPYLWLLLELGTEPGPALQYLDSGSSSLCKITDFRKALQGDAFFETPHSRSSFSKNRREKEGRLSCVNSGKSHALAVGAHPDDVEFMCAGTLLLLKEAGHPVDVATLTFGDLGSSEHGRSEISTIRRGEAEAACRRLGAGYHGLGFEDFCILYSEASIRKVTGLLRDVVPDLVLTHPPVDYLIDHESTSSLVRTACFAAPVPNLDTSAYSQAPPTNAVPALYYWSPVEGVDIYGEPVEPQCFVDVTEVFDRKVELLAFHESQRNWLRSHHGVDEYLESMRRWSLEMGRLASARAGRAVMHAEGFRQHRGHAYPRENLLKSLLGGVVIEV